MSSAAPLVTVVVPAFNAERTLADTLRSVLAQTYRNIEVLVVDDGSTDGTADVAESLAADDPRLSLIRKENGGCASARNLGIARAHGVFVAPIDADDLWHPTKIERQVSAALAAAEPPGFVYCFFRPIDGDGNLARPVAPYTCRGNVLLHHLHTNFVGNGSGPLLFRAAALEAGGYDERLGRQGAIGCEDLLLQLQIARRHPVEVVPEFLVGYRTGVGGMSADRRRMYRSWRIAIGIILEEEPAIPPPVLRWTHARRCFSLAEAVANEGRYGECAWLLARALWLDPRATLGRLRFRITRLLRRRIRPLPMPASRPFLKCSTIERFPADAYENGHAWLSLRRMDERRRVWIDRHAARLASDCFDGPAVADGLDRVVPAWQ
jgi:hypothetical protein